MLATIPPRYFDGQDSYAYAENFLTEEDINTILALPEWHNSNPGLVGNEDSGSGLKEETRITDVSWWYPSDKNAFLLEKIIENICYVNSKFFHYDLSGCYEAAQLGVYKAGNKGHYDWHVDASIRPGRVPRKLSVALMLSDPSEFEGGNLEIKPYNDEPIQLEQKRGRAWFFPSYMLHRVTPVTSGTRRSLVLWVGGPPFK